MSKEKDNTNQVSNDKEEASNVESIYSYTEALIKTQEESLNRLDTKLSGFLAFAGVLLRFAVDLPDKYELGRPPAWVVNVSLTFKFFACMLSMFAIVVCVLGLIARMRGAVADPETLMSDTWYWEEPSRYKAFIINTWIETSKEYKRLGLKKGKTLNLAIKLICGAAIAFGLNIALLTFYR